MSSACRAFCSTIKIATPVCLTSRMRSNRSSITIGDTPAVGSSSINTRGWDIRARPKATCWRCPPESSPANWACFSDSIGNSSNTCSMDSLKLSVRKKAPISRFSRTVILTNTLLVWGTKAIPSAIRACVDRLVISLSLKRTDPDLSSSIPSIALMAVDFPAPLGPTMTAISPSSTSTVQPLSISAPPYPPVIFSPIR